MTDLLLIFVSFMPLFLLVFYLFRSKPVYWMVAFGSFLLIGLTGVNALCLNLVKVALSLGNFIALFILEGIVSVILLFLLARKSIRWELLGSALLSFAKRNSRQIFLLIMFLVVILLLSISLENRPKTGYSVIYVQEPSYQNSPWKITIPTSAFVQIIVILQDHELERSEFSLEVVRDGTFLLGLDLGTLSPGDTIRQEISLPPSVLPNSHYEILLYKGNLPTTYRTISLWIHRQ